MLKDVCTKKYTFEESRRLVIGTFAVEGITLSEETERNLLQLANKEKTADQIIEEIITQYSEKSK